MKIGLFQLENLSLIPARFVFLDLRVDPVPLHPQVERILLKAEKVSFMDVEGRLASADKTAPVVLLCENGKASSELATRLENSGFQNVYVVSGGAEGLLSEL